MLSNTVVTFFSLAESWQAIPYELFIAEDISSSTLGRGPRANSGAGQPVETVPVAVRDGPAVESICIGRRISNLISKPRIVVFSRCRAGSQSGTLYFFRTADEHDAGIHDG
jgi:hypothetical protein